MIKKYVVDTNVIIEDPHIIDKLNGMLYIPTTVLRELDKLKYAEGIKGYNIREFVRRMDDNKNLFSIINSDNFGASNDDKIIQATKKIQEKEKSIILVTNDILMSFLAKSQNINVQRHELLIQNKMDIYNGVVYDDEIPQYPNQYQINKSGIFRLKNTQKTPTRLGKDIKIWGIKHKNAEQRCAIDALMDDKIKLVTLSGIAGTGKTLLAIAAGLEKSIGKDRYSKLLISRPIVPMGHDIGFLPGDINEKLAPWMQPIFDNIDFLFAKNEYKNNDCWKELEKEGLLKIEALTYIRGRSIPKQFILIDEGQNLTKHEMKTIISRAGDNTKIVITGDPDQIDNPKLNAKNNGLTYVIEKFKDQEIAAHITLVKGERSELANLAAKIL